MNLRAIDLNLLVALDALLGELHITRAAERIGLSQPAMSNALGRLRHVFKDELLVRTGRGMQPTARAEALREAIRPLLRQVERVFEGDTGFDPASAARSFTLRLSDLLGFLLLPALLDRIRRAAPAVALDILARAVERDPRRDAVPRSHGLRHAPRP